MSHSGSHVANVATAQALATIAGPCAGRRRAGDRISFSNAFAEAMARPPGARPPWVPLVQRLSGLVELDELITMVEANGRPDAPAALAEVMQIHYDIQGLDNLHSVGTRPVVLFANHPTGGGNVLGLCIVMARRFGDYRILGNQHMKFLRSLAQHMIPVDPFCSTAPLNLRSLGKLREEFGTSYQTLGVFPAGISSRLQLDGTIADRRWSDAFIRIARHHDALLVPVWFSGRNRLRYYIAARLRAELGFLALPGEFLRLRGQSIVARIGKPVAPETLRTIGDRDAQLNFLRASVYGLADRELSGRSRAPAGIRGLHARGAEASS